MPPPKVELKILGCSVLSLQSYLDDTHIVFNYTEKLLESNLKRITVVQYTATLAEVNQ